jgi:hypothetical protein
MPLFNHAHYATLWARQLHKEFEDICWSHQVRLEPPVIEIFDSSRHLGEWHQEARTIRISSELILRHPWAVTINVLKHEMAHQLCSAHGLSEAGHGPAFQEACLRLGVPQAFRSARGDSPEIFTDLKSESELVTSGRRFFAKVEKLLALARSANEHEAALAMHKANELIAKYNLEQRADDADRSYRHLVINSGRKRIHGWQRAIGILLQDFFYVRIVLAQAYDPLSDEHHKTIDLFGKSENVAVAEYCYRFLERELDFLWQAHRARSGRKGITEKHSYYLGVLNGFRQTLQAQQHAGRPSPQSRPTAAAHQALAATTSALTVAADRRLDDFVALRYPRLRRRAHAGSRVNPTTYDHGRADGRNIVLNKGVTHQDGNQGRLLPF